MEIAKLFEEFYEREKENYPGMEFKEMRDLIKTPWIFLKREMENGLLRAVRFKYFGLFIVYQGRAKYMRRKTIENFEKGYISKEKHDKCVAMLDKQ
jgi:hypothetical protein